MEQNYFDFHKFNLRNLPPEFGKLGVKAEENAYKDTEVRLLIETHGSRAFGL